MHVWEWYDPAQKKWVEKSKVAFPINGGRNNGYRGYSNISDVPAGKWRVTIETTEGQAIGRIEFAVQEVSMEPALHTETR